MYILKGFNGVKLGSKTSFNIPNDVVHVDEIDGIKDDALLPYLPIGVASHLFSSDMVNSCLDQAKYDLIKASRDVENGYFTWPVDQNKHNIF